MKFRLLLSATTVAALLAGCALQDTGAPIFDRTGQGSATATTSPVMTGQTYVVQPGDTLYRIAVNHGCDPTELAQANGITDPTQVSIGTVLRLTAPRTAPVTTVAVDAVTGTDSQTVVVGDPYAQGNSQSVDLTGSQDSTSVSLSTTTTAPTQPVAPAGQKALGNTVLSWPVARGPILTQFSDTGSKGVEIGGQMGADVRAAAAGRVIYTGENVSGYGKLIIVSHAPGVVTVYGHNSELLVKRGDNVTNGQVIAKMGDSDSRTVNLLFEVRYNDKPVNPLEYLPQ